jgi:hypothetical protein
VVLMIGIKKYIVLPFFNYLQLNWFNFGNNNFLFMKNLLKLKWHLLYFKPELLYRNLSLYYFLYKNKICYKKDYNKITYSWKILNILNPMKILFPIKKKWNCKYTFCIKFWFTFIFTYKPKMYFKFKVYKELCTNNFFFICKLKPKTKLLE